MINPMRCPGCNDETCDEELIQGKCPMCGTRIVDHKDTQTQASAEPFIKCISDYDVSPVDFGDMPVRDIINDIFEDIFSGVERTLLISYMAYDISQNT
ncbi:MAG TPA: hypothetical protein VK436_05295, partial [Methanocella sp.]|nr:hypothetical protein [Methanocella sp.]